MKKIYRYFGLTMSVFTTLYGLVRYAPNTRTSANSWRSESFGELSRIEDMLSLGFPAPLACMDEVDLESIPGISSVTAARIMKQQKLLLRQGSQMTANKALQSVYGIGELRAAVLSRYVSLSLKCKTDRHSGGNFTQP